MKAFTLAALSLFALVAAQSLSDLPACATTCALNSISSTGCAVTDNACICGNQGFLSGVQQCITAPGGCNEADVQATLAFAATFCGNDTIANGTSAANGTASTTTTATESSGTASETASESSPESTASESSSEASSGASSASESAASATSSDSFAAPTLVAMGIAQFLGVAAVVGAAL
ncbi:uncharacterized protein HMPREF1541_06389 [Cyphellophora europaea CBS 101466]|uniref:CFEM domain-containing protein n=1 Tax=Cyphellophora europaea (strain CBS 101466) TaxID=1220924 RepID=W2RRK7_CYPE1|nr:uncharacterized protein HMPREF1541_06389 [Cyphellophora europaea CBS 101466]ETN38354.1 hypothetical protein HMPREF1541_06389 [Cyphellophora europaea CBS 101466]